MTAGFTGYYCKIMFAYTLPPPPLCSLSYPEIFNSTTEDPGLDSVTGIPRTSTPGRFDPVVTVIMLSPAG